MTNSIDEVGVLLVKKYMGTGKIRGGKPLPPWQERLYSKFISFVKEQGFTITDSPISGGNSKRVSDIRILPISPETFMRNGIPEYKKRGSEFEVLHIHMEIGKPTLFIGPSGIGKTLGVDKFAETEKIPLIRYDCSENTKRSDLIGRFLLIGEETVFQLGILPTAIHVANITKKAILCFEEINALTGAMQKILNQLLDYRRMVFVDGLGTIYELLPESRLLICASMNPTGGIYGGTNPLNEDLLARFAVMRWDYPKEDEEKKQLNTKDIPTEVVTGLMQLSMESRAALKNGTLERAISPRDNGAFFDLYRAYSKSKELDPFVEAMNRMILDKYESPEGVTLLKKKVESIFGIVIKEDGSSKKLVKGTKGTTKTVSGEYDEDEYK